MKVKELIEILEQRNQNADVNLMVESADGKYVADVIPVNGIEMICDEGVVMITGRQTKIAN